MRTTALFGQLLDDSQSRRYIDGEHILLWLVQTEIEAPSSEQMIIVAQSKSNARN